MNNLLAWIALYGFAVTIPSTYLDSQDRSTISKNGMTISWYHHKDRVYFEMEAPCPGWVAIGFNESAALPGTYLVMGNVVNGTATVTEHHTFKPGDYRALPAIGAGNRVEDVSGSQTDNKTIIHFSLPVDGEDKYRKNLSKDLEYSLLIAFSREDDFQHHSIMRTSTTIKL